MRWLASAPSSAHRLRHPSFPSLTHHTHTCPLPHPLSPSFDSPLTCGEIICLVSRPSGDAGSEPATAAGRARRHSPPQTPRSFPHLRLRPSPTSRYSSADNERWRKTTSRGFARLRSPMQSPNLLMNLKDMVEPRKRRNRHIVADHLLAGEKEAADEVWPSKKGHYGRCRRRLSAAEAIRQARASPRPWPASYLAVDKRPLRTIAIAALPVPKCSAVCTCLSEEIWRILVRFQP